MRIFLDEKKKRLKEYLTELEKSLHEYKKYYDYDDPDCKEIRDIENLFGEVNEDYYKSIKTEGAFNGSYIEYECRGDKDKILSPKEYFDMIRPYLRNIINNHKASMKLKLNLPDKAIDYETQFGEWKIQITMQISFNSSKYFEETRTMSTKSDNIDIMMGNETDNIIEELCETLLQKYQNRLEEKTKESDFVRDSVDLLYYHLHKSSLRRGESCIKCPKWLRNKRATINKKKVMIIAFSML